MQQTGSHLWGINAGQTTPSDLPPILRGSCAEQLCVHVTARWALMEKPLAQNALTSPLSTADSPQPAPHWEEPAGSVCSHLSRGELGVTFGTFPSEHPRECKHSPEPQLGSHYSINQVILISGALCMK